MVHRRLFAALLAGCGLAALADAALADPPSRVGRVSDVEGQISFLPPGEQDWAEALRNYPVTSGESFWTGDAGRLELQFGSVQARVDSETELDVVDLDDGDTRLSIPQGSVDIRLWRAPDGGVTIATPAGDVQLDQPGAYRIDVGAPDQSGEYPPVEVTTLEGGDAGAPGPGGFVGVPVGAAAVIYAGYDPQLQDAQDADIDDWARTREARLRYDQVNWDEERAPGYSDLSDYGQFAQDPTYGEVWYPADVAPDWAPYRYGQWSYVEPWGWTWIDDAPWGFTPFHYGRWVNVDGRWGWTPGQREQRPVYAPALVAFIGGLEGGAFAWAPLAPDEPYIPPYEVSDDYVRRVNVANVSAPVLSSISAGARPTLAAWRLRNAAATSAIPAAAVGRGGKVQQSAVPVTPQALARAQVSPGAALAAPPKPSGGARAGAAGGLHAAPPPPAKVQQLRAAVAQTPKGSTAPPPIPGVHKAAAAPPTGAAAARPIAPAAASGRQPPPKPLAPRTNAVTGAPVGAAPGRPRQPLPKPTPNLTGSAPETRPLRRSPPPTPSAAASPAPASPSATTEGGTARGATARGGTGAAPKAHTQTSPTTTPPRTPPASAAGPAPKAPAAQQGAKPAPGKPPPKKPAPKSDQQSDEHAPS